MTPQRTHKVPATLLITIAAVITLSMTGLMACSGPQTPQPFPTIAPVTPTPTTAPPAITPPSGRPRSQSSQAPLPTIFPITSPGTESTPTPETNPATSTAQPTQETGPTSQPATPPNHTEIPGPGSTGTATPAPLTLDSNQAATLSPEEKECATQKVDARNLQNILSDPDLTNSEEMKHIIGCLEEDTLYNVIISEYASNTAPLSQETTECLTASYNEIDLRGLLLAGIDGELEATMAAGTAALTATLTCLKDDEWLTVAPQLGMTTTERDVLLCTIDELGGPSTMAHTLMSEDSDAFLTLIEASATCELRVNAETIQNQTTQPPQPAQDHPTQTPIPNLNGQTKGN